MSDRLRDVMMTVAEVQQRLNEGCASLVVTAVLDRRTITAIRSFQRAHNLDPTGALDDVTVKALEL